MAYLDNSTITVDAVLTKKGREILSKGGDVFKITKFALCDDEVDYGLWNPLHPGGSDDYGKVIENMPVLEALIDETQAMRYKLITIDNLTTTNASLSLPYIDIQVPNVGGSIEKGSTVTFNATRLQSGFMRYTITPQTLLMENGIANKTLDLVSTLGNSFGYTFTINKSFDEIKSESTGLITSLDQFVGINSNVITATPPSYSGDINRFSTVTALGSALEITVFTNNSVKGESSVELPMTVTGNQSGAVFDFLVKILLKEE